MEISRMIRRLARYCVPLISGLTTAKIAQLLLSLTHVPNPANVVGTVFGLSVTIFCFFLLRKQHVEPEYLRVEWRGLHT